MAEIKATPSEKTVYCMKDQELYLFTAAYPYGSTEPFLENELKVLEKHFSKITLFPGIKLEGDVRQLPANAVFIDPSSQQVHMNKRLYLSHAFLILRILFSEFLYCPGKKVFLKRLPLSLAELKKALALALYLKKFKPDENKVLYSLWMNEWALALALLKEKKEIMSFVFRILGFDIYDERWKEGFIPFRRFIYKNCTRVYPNSSSSANYVKAKRIFPEKIHTSYFGTPDHGVVFPAPEQIFTIFTCSRLIPLKRVPELGNALALLDFPVIWVHHGDGPDLERLLEVVKEFPSQIRFIHSASAQDHGKLIEQIRKTQPHLFINYSETEGLPVTLIEAASFGIPLLATDVGGSKEIVTSETGILIPLSTTAEKTAEIISDFRISFRNTETYRKNVRLFWEKNFEAQKNYSNFALEIIENQK